MIWLDNHIQIDPPKRTKKMTATRFAAVLGKNVWASPFQMWAEITKTYEKPFEDTIYTIAGKTIEPKQIQYMRDSYLMFNLKDPTDIYGEDFFHKTWGDFFHNTPIFGGMWDSILVDSEGKPEAVLEFKTSKRAEDWASDVPEYYALQASLYAYLLGVDQVIMVASFLQPDDYNHPQDYQPSASNTITREFKVSERYPDFQNMIGEATQWWNDHVVTGISPEWDESRDAEILEALRTNHPQVENDIVALIKESEKLREQIENAKRAVGLANLEKLLKGVEERIKDYSMAQFREGDKKVQFSGEHLTYTMSRTESVELDKKALEADGLLEKYSKPKVSFRLTTKAVEEKQ